MVIGPSTPWQPTVIQWGWRCSHADHVCYLDDDWRCHARTGPVHSTNHEIFAYKTLLSAILYLFWGCCFGDGGSMVLVYDYLELYGANAQNTYRLLIQKSYCSRPIHTKRCWAVCLERIESRTLESHESLVWLVCLVFQVYQCLSWKTAHLLKKSKIWNLKPNCIYSWQSTEQHDYRETEEQNSSGCKLFVKKDA